MLAEGVAWSFEGIERLVFHMTELELGNSAETSSFKWGICRIGSTSVRGQNNSGNGEPPPPPLLPLLMTYLFMEPGVYNDSPISQILRFIRSVGLTE
jgi:hypothetical protein